MKSELRNSKPNLDKALAEKLLESKDGKGYVIPIREERIHHSGTVKDIEMFHKKVTKARSGDMIAILVKDCRRNISFKGMVISNSQIDLAADAQQFLA